MESDFGKSRVMNINRRQFLGSASILAIVGAAGVLGGCSPQSSNAGLPASNDSASNTVPASQAMQADETQSCDIVIVGAGGSGLAASVQASELGASVICIESQLVPGGNLNGVEGCFGIDSSMQKEKGIIIDPGTTIRSEITASQFRASGLGYVDMVHASGENIDWLIEQGVQFEGVDVDKGDMLVFHRFANRGIADYVPYMAQKAEENGVIFLYETKGEQLIKDDTGAVVGLYASKADGTILRIDSKSVIVATGGFADNEELMSGQGFQKEKMRNGGMPGHDGSGHKMAVEAGALSNLPSVSYLSAFYVNGTPGYYDNGKFAFVIGVAAPYSIWINEKGERYVNEDFTMANIMLMSLPYRQNKDNFIIMDQNMMDVFLNGDPESLKQLQDGIDEGSIFQAETLDVLGKTIGLDDNVFAGTISRYNAFAETGSDKDFGKEASFLLPFSHAPFYAINPILEVNTSIGSIQTDRSFHALDESHNPIDGLYVIGVEGAMLWSNVYTINISGSCNANNINSGRIAAKDAVSKL